MACKRFAAVGIGGRIPMFIDPLAGRYRAEADLVGLCDPSLVRLRHHQRRLVERFGGEPVAVFQDFERMLKEARPDCVIVCTPDHTHHTYIVRSLEAGADVISEKPLTIDAEKCRTILAAVERTGRRLTTTFNMRWSPGVSQVRELLASGAIGQVRHIDFEYTLNTSHGADYFRRWHSHKALSGGLLLHKSTHHFDVLNWWIDGIPETVFAFGDLVYYGKANAVARGEERLTRYPRYTGIPEAADDPFRLNLTDDPDLKSLYYDAEAESGYIRDENVFRDGIDIEDSMSLLIRYRTGTMVAYSLNAYSPSEGFRASLSGDRGRITYSEEHGSHIVTGGTHIGGSEDEFRTHLVLHRHFSPPEEIPVVHLPGGHGGADPLLQEQLFAAHPPADPLGRGAGHEQGAASLLIGAAANLSMRSGRPVTLSELVPLRPGATRLSELI